jgi:hypothetical protein
LTPIAFGLLQPEICLPARAANMEPASLRAMLSHELAHLRRWDPAWMWLAALVQALCPWQLLLPVVRRRWSRVVELRCDAEAAARTSPTAVARCLLEVAEWLRPGSPAPAVALGMAARPSALRERVEAALAATHPPAPRPLLRGALAGASLAALTLAAPGLHQSAPMPSAGGDALGFAVEPDLPAGASRAELLRMMLAQLQQEHDQLVVEALDVEQLLHDTRVPAAAQLRAALAQRLLALERTRRQLEAQLAPDPFPIDRQDPFPNRGEDR